MNYEFSGGAFIRIKINRDEPLYEEALKVILKHRRHPFHLFRGI